MLHYFGFVINIFGLYSLHLLRMKSSMANPLIYILSNLIQEPLSPHPSPLLIPWLMNPRPKLQVNQKQKRLLLEQEPFYECATANFTTPSTVTESRHVAWMHFSINHHDDDDEDVKAAIASDEINILFRRRCNFKDKNNFFFGRFYLKIPAPPFL